MGDEIKQLIDMVARLKIALDEGFEAVEKRFQEIDNRFEQVDRRFEAIDSRFQQIDNRFEEIDNRFEAMDKRFDEVDKRFDRVEIGIEELNTNQIKILNSMKLLEQDVRSNKKHIERLEEQESYL